MSTEHNTTSAETLEKAVDFLPLNGTDFIEFWVGNAKQAAHYYMSAFGFELVAYAGPETGVRDRASYVLKQDKVRFVLTSSIVPDSEISEHVKLHGDGVKTLALWVDDAEKSFNETVKRGAKPAMEPKTLTDEFGEVKVASIHTYGETIHTFVERKNYKGPFMPGFVKRESEFKPEPIGLKYVD
ncbi:MAG: VOC family protein, partial [Hymenobacteraceae bacterium]|nr:VOC family protein [Hymenobacteraceae bacterium]MDX5394568.1 VOC family protein [Hymenobacteraceae bacterium]MDX5510589.1 VOC family protein [Hymenobacteraceae bacterium]